VRKSFVAAFLLLLVLLGCETGASKAGPPQVCKKGHCEPVDRGGAQR
jgi:hypothetical protein